MALLLKLLKLNNHEVIDFNKLPAAFPVYKNRFKK